MKTVTLKPVTKQVQEERLPLVNEVFFDQFKQIPAKIVQLGNVDILVKFQNSSHLRAFRFREIVWNDRAGWWTFKEEPKEYYVWVERESCETSKTQQGTWEKASSIPMSRVTAAATEKLLRHENPELDFSVSIGKPSSYFV